MWDTLFRHPLGRLSQRNILVAATTLVLALFIATLTNTNVYAATDATWNENNELVYEKNVYSGPISSPPTGVVPSDSESVFRYQESNTSYSYIYFKKGVDYKTAKSATVVKATYGLTSGTYNISENPKSITLAQQANSPPGGEDDSEEGASSCNIDNIGWIVCPVTTWLAEGIDGLYSFLSTFLNVRPLLDGNNSIYRLWEIMRNFANIAFVMAFLIIIYGQLVGGGLTNYNIKRLLPRIIVAAVLVNISYWICAVAVDLSNIFGHGIQNLFINMRDYAEVDENKNITWAQVATVALSGGAIGGTAFLTVAAGSTTAVAFFLFSAVISALFAIFVAVIILAARQAIITVLIIIAPLAFVAYLLPGTEKWFDRWKNSLGTLLMMFPIFSLIFGGSQLAGMAIIQNAANIVIVILGLAVMVTPLIITPMLIKLSGGILAQFANVVNNKQRGIFDGAKNFSRDLAGHHKDKALGSKPALGRFSARGMAQAIDTNKRAREGRRKNYQAAAERRYTGSKAYHSNHLASRDIDDATKNLQTSAENDYLKSDAYEAHHVVSHDLDVAKKTIESAHEVHLQARVDPRDIHFNRNAFDQEMQMRVGADQANLAQAKIDSTYSEMKAGVSPLHAMEHHGPNDANMQHMVTQTQNLSHQIARESLRKQMADRKDKTEMTNQLLENEEMRTYAGGVMGNVGSESVLAGAVAEYRKEYDSNVQNQKQLIKHFNLSGSQRQNLAMGINENLTIKDEESGREYTFKIDDNYAREAAIEMQLGGAGNVENVEQIISRSGSDLSEFRTTISTMIVDGRVADKASYLAGKSIDDVAQGKIKGDDDLTALATRAVAQGKVKPSHLATMDATALERVVKSTTEPNLKLTTDPKDIADLERRQQALYREAARVLTDSNISGTIAENSRDQLQILASRYEGPTMTPVDD